jgi:hypothetical protein
MKRKLTENSESFCDVLYDHLGILSQEAAQLEMLSEALSNVGLTKLSNNLHQTAENIQESADAIKDSYEEESIQTG